MKKKANILNTITNFLIFPFFADFSMIFPHFYFFQKIRSFSHWKITIRKKLMMFWDIDDFINTSLDTSWVELIFTIMHNSPPLLKYVWDKNFT